MRVRYLVAGADAHGPVRIGDVRELDGEELQQTLVGRYAVPADPAPGRDEAGAETAVRAPAPERAVKPPAGLKPKGR